MTTGATVSRLHDLIHQRLRHYTETELISLTKEMEKDLLISLSQVLMEIRRWIGEIGSDSVMTSSSESEEQIVDDEESPVVSPISGSEEYTFLEKIVSDFVALIGMKNPYIQHLAGNVLVEVSEFLIESGRHWNDFIHMLCDCVLSSFNFSSSHMLLEHTLKNNTNVYMVSGVFRVLRIILKRLNQEENDKLLGVFFQSIDYTLTSFPPSLLNELHADCEMNSQGRGWALGRITDHDQGTVFLGVLVQFFCSLSRFLEDTSRSNLTNQILLKIINLVPDLLQWCRHTHLENQIDTCMSRYLMHKILVLMIKLSYQSDLNCTTLLTWLQCLHLHFQRFLQQPICRPEPVHDNCLDSSPFLTSLSDGEVHKINSNHLQRLTVFLFLRCSFILISSRKHIDNQCDPDFRNKGLQEIREWIEEQIPGYCFSNQGTCFEKHMNFSTSFVRLYMHEDDLLFKVLLQLLAAPLDGEKLFNEGKLSLQDEEQTVLFCLSNLFDPLGLFCIVLFELRYDHQVLLDYLISKDTGISCAEYLLRCLRTISNSWNLFVEFRLKDRTVDVSSSKKRKILLEYGWKQRHAYEDVKKCLLSLKISIENLHQKQLFPYNPEVLLKRLSRFQELCLCHE